MKFQKLLVIAASVCLLAVFVSGSAYAQLQACEKFASDFGEACNRALRQAGRD